MEIFEGMVTVIDNLMKSGMNPAVILVVAMMMVTPFFMITDALFKLATFESRK